MFAWGLILNLVRHLTRKARMQLRNNIGSGTGKNKNLLLIQTGDLQMKKVFTLMISLVLFLSVAIAPVWAGGDKVQNENGIEAGDGSDAQGNQVGGD